MSIAIKINRKKGPGFENVTEVIQLREPRAKDLFGLEFTGPSQMQSIAILISRCSSLIIKEVEELEGSEFLKLQDQINKFLEFK